MTGISVSNARPRKDQLPCERYHELKQAPEQFNIIQLGISLFHANTNPAAVPSSSGRGYSNVVAPPRDTTSLYTARRFNIYMFPAPAGRNEPERNIIMSPSTVAFLHKHNMSFDTWTKQGVPFVNEAKARELLRRFRPAGGESSNTAKPRQRVVLRTQHDITFRARAMAGVRGWLDNAQEQQQSSRDAPLAEDGALPEEGLSFLLPPCNSFLRRALYESLEEEYPMLNVEKTADDRLRVIRLTPEEKAERDERIKKTAWESLICDKLGVYRVFEALRKACNGEAILHDSVLFAPSHDKVDWSKDHDHEPSVSGRKIPLIVHHGFMDLCFLLTHFHSARLPSSLLDCKALIRSYFPIIYDTKILATESVLVSRSAGSRSTGVGELFETMVRTSADNTDPFLDRIRVDAQDVDDQEHEAAYDAFMTGAIFASMLEKIKPQAPNVMQLLCDDTDPNTRVFLHRNFIYQFSIFTMDLEETNLYAEPMSLGMTTGGTYLLSGPGAPNNNREITAALSNVTDSEDRPVHYEIMWISDTEVLVAASCRECPMPPPPDWIENAAREHGRFLEACLSREFTKASITTLKTVLSRRAIIDQLRRFMGNVLGVFDASAWLKRDAPDGTCQQRKRQRTS